MAISSPHKSSSPEKQKKISAFKNKFLHKRPTTSSQGKPIKKVKFDFSQEEGEDLKKPVVCQQKEGSKKEEGAALDRAYEVQARLPPSLPSFVKLMLKSHVTGGFWLGLPRRFCVKHLPVSDETVTLEDECGKAYQTKYLWAKTGLSGGWRGFSIDQGLLEGDVLVFQLIKPCRFKVYISRVNGSAEVNGSIGLLKLDLQPKPLKIVAPIKDEDEDEDENENNPEMDASDNTSEGSPNACDNIDELSFETEVLEETTISDSVGEFKDVKTLEDFRITVDDGLVIDSEIPTNIRTKYYHLCTSQNDYLHRHLLKPLNCKLAAGIITETVNVSDAIKAAKITTPLEELEIWDKTLKAFEDVGMALGFLRAHISKLIACHSEQTEMFQRKMEERGKLEEERKYLETKIVNVKGVMDGLDEEIKVLQVQNAGSELAFLEMASAPW